MTSSRFLLALIQGGLACALCLQLHVGALSQIQRKYRSHCGIFPAIGPVGAAAFQNERPLWHGRYPTYRGASHRNHHFSALHARSCGSVWPARRSGIGGRTAHANRCFPACSVRWDLATPSEAPYRAAGRVAMQMQRAQLSGKRQLLVSDENMMGTSRHNLRSCTLYPAIGERMARLADAFRGRVSRVVLSVRSSGSLVGLRRSHDRRARSSSAVARAAGRDRL